MTAHGVLPFGSAADVARALPAAVAHLRADGVIAHPTETVYGVGGALTEAALERVRALKGRDEGKPFVVLVGAMESLTQLGVRKEALANRLISAFWPGPLTLVLPSSLTLPRGAQNERGGVAVRWTSHPGMSRLLEAFGAPLTSTSANAAGLPPARSAPEIVALWREPVGKAELLVLDGGEVEGGRLPSTVVDCTGRAPRVVRKGAVSVAALRTVVPQLEDEA